MEVCKNLNDGISRLIDNGYFIGGELQVVDIIFISICRGFLFIEGLFGLIKLND